MADTENKEEKQPKRITISTADQRAVNDKEYKKAGKEAAKTLSKLGIRSLTPEQRSSYAKSLEGLQKVRQQLKDSDVGVSKDNTNLDGTAKTKKQIRAEERAEKNAKDKEEHIKLKQYNAEHGLNMDGTKKKDRTKTQEEKDAGYIERSKEAGKKKTKQREDEEEAKKTAIKIPLKDNVSLVWYANDDRIKKGVFDVDVISDGRKQRIPNLTLQGLANLRKYTLPDAMRNAGLNPADVNYQTQFTGDVDRYSKTKDGRNFLTKAGAGLLNAWRTGNFNKTTVARPRIAENIVRFEDLPNMPMLDLNGPYYLPVDEFKRLFNQRLLDEEDLIAKGFDPDEIRAAMVRAERPENIRDKESFAELLSDLRNDIREENKSNVRKYIADVEAQLSVAKDQGQFEDVKKFNYLLNRLNEALEKGTGVTRTDKGFIFKTSLKDTYKDAIKAMLESGDKFNSGRFDNEEFGTRALTTNNKKRATGGGWRKKFFQGDTEGMQDFLQKMADIGSIKRQENIQKEADKYYASMSPEEKAAIAERNASTGRFATTDDVGVDVDEDKLMNSYDFKQKYKNLIGLLRDRYPVSGEVARQVVPKSAFRKLITRDDMGRIRYDIDEFVKEFGPELANRLTQGNITNALAGRVM